MRERLLSVHEVPTPTIEAQKSICMFHAGDSMSHIWVLSYSHFIKSLGKHWNLYEAAPLS